MHELDAGTVSAGGVPPHVPPLVTAKPLAFCVILGVSVISCDCLLVIVTYLLTVSPKCSLLIVTLAGAVVTSTLPLPSSLIVAVPSGASSTMVSVPVRPLVELIALGVKLMVIVQVSGDGPTVYG